MPENTIPAGGAEDEISVLLVIPTFNNHSSLREIVSGALKSCLNTLVVDDGSTDSTLETIKHIPVVVIKHPQNMGKGRAVLSGANWADGQGYSHIITIDADGQHNPDDIPKFLDKIKEKPLSIIVGTRDFESGPVPESSVFGRKFSNFWVRVSSGSSIADSQSGFRAYPLDVLNKVKCHSLRYNFEVEILVRAVWAGIILSSLDISVDYNEATTKASHFRPFMDNFRISLTYTRLVLRNFFPWPHKILFGQTQHEKAVNFFLHPIRGMKSLAMENSTPKQIALAVTVGIFLATLPLLAAHSVTIVFVATRLKLNRLIALNVSHLCAPPFVPALAVELGYYLRNGRFLTEFTMQTLGYEALQRFWDYLLGAVVLAPFLALFAGGIAYLIVRFFKDRNGKPVRREEAKSLG